MKSIILSGIAVAALLAPLPALGQVPARRQDDTHFQVVASREPDRRCRPWYGQASKIDFTGTPSRCGRQTRRL